MSAAVERWGPHRGSRPHHAWEPDPDADGRKGRWRTACGYVSGRWTLPPESEKISADRCHHCRRVLEDRKRGYDAREPVEAALSRAWPRGLTKTEIRRRTKDYPGVKTDARFEALMDLLEGEGEVRRWDTAGDRTYWTASRRLLEARGRSTVALGAV